MSCGYAPSGTAGSADYVDITDVQLKIGGFTAAQATYERRAIVTEIQLAQRFYWAPGLPNIVFGYCGSTSQPVYTYDTFPVQMRASPTTAGTFSNGTNVSVTAIYATP